MAAPEARNLVSRWDDYLVQLQLQPQGMCLVQLLRTQLDQPRSDWEASWPRRLGQEEEGLSDGRKCLLSQVTGAADIATLGVLWALGQRVGLSPQQLYGWASPPAHSVVPAGEHSDHSPNQNAHPVLSQEDPSVGIAPPACSPHLPVSHQQLSPLRLKGQGCWGAGHVGQKGLAGWAGEAGRHCEGHPVPPCSGVSNAWEVDPWVPWQWAALALLAPYFSISTLRCPPPQMFLFFYLYCC